MVEENKQIEEKKENIKTKSDKGVKEQDKKSNLKQDKESLEQSGKKSQSESSSPGSVEVNNKDKKAEDKREGKKKELVKAPKKTEVKVSGRDLRVSTKQAVAVCRFIKNKDVDKAIGELEEVSKMKRAIPMKGELPHRKGKMMSGRFPVKAALEFIKLLKSLKANAINHEVELEKVRVVAMANVASRPYRRFGRERFKRSHVEIRLVPFEMKVNENKPRQDKKGKVSESKSEQSSEEQSPKNKKLDVNKKEDDRLNEDED